MEIQLLILLFGMVKKFKIDLIVWKWLLNSWFNICNVMFKIDLIVWKYGYSSNNDRIVDGLK